MNDRPARPDQRWATAAIILIVIGAVFLLGELFNLRIGGGVWPLFMLIPGVVLLFLGFNRPTVNTGAAIPGAVLTTLGLIFFYQQATNNWESWAYIWALIPLSIGLVLYLAGNRNGDGESVTNGLRMMRIFGALFVAGLVFFELLIFDRGGLGGYLLPIVLIVVGVGILVYYYREHGSLPFGDFGGTGSATDRPSSPGPTPPSPTSSTSAATPRPARPAPARSQSAPAAAAPPPTSSAPTASGDRFPEGEPPHEPAPDTPFPADEEAPDTTSAPPGTETATEPSTPAKDGSKASTTAAKPRRRRTTSSTRKTSTPPKNETNEGS